MDFWRSLLGKDHQQGVVETLADLRKCPFTWRSQFFAGENVRDHAVLGELCFHGFPEHANAGILRGWQYRADRHKEREQDSLHSVVSELGEMASLRVPGFLWSGLDRFSFWNRCRVAWGQLSLHRGRCKNVGRGQPPSSRRLDIPSIVFILSEGLPATPNLTKPLELSWQTVPPPKSMMEEKHV